MATNENIRKKISKKSTIKNEETAKALTELQFPTENGDGQELYDANDNRIITLEERTEMLEKLEHKFVEVMDILRISRNDPNCERTPRRLSKMFINELLAGRYAPPPKSTIFPNRKKVDELIISKGIEVMSVCSHHWQPISGTCAIGYIPGNYVIGISKLSRIVDWFARRGQIQEELGEQIADYIEELMHPKALGVVIKARHYCMIARGVRGSEEKSFMVTSVMRGYLANDLNLRNEFLKL
ncbi:MAG TPA: GTP cyclohydrolase I, partial [Candidatus Kapabacteria bacterium]|nr:GTP cyclohydrolase I [Candidatus Kapabacteria bacterium]